MTGNYSVVDHLMLSTINHLSDTIYPEIMARRVMSRMFSFLFSNFASSSVTFPSFPHTSQIVLRNYNELELNSARPAAGGVCGPCGSGGAV